jgi:formate--tetrahydrofolate ligase
VQRRSRPDRVQVDGGGQASVGAGFIYPICGEMTTMPGLPEHPAAEKVDIDENGQIVGLF